MEFMLTITVKYVTIHRIAYYIRRTWKWGAAVKSGKCQITHN